MRHYNSEQSVEDEPVFWPQGRVIFAAQLTSSVLRFFPTRAGVSEIGWIYIRYCYRGKKNKYSLVQVHFLKAASSTLERTNNKETSG
jgi:hypothetical protein